MWCGEAGRGDAASRAESSAGRCIAKVMLIAPSGRAAGTSGLAADRSGRAASLQRLVDGTTNQPHGRANETLLMRHGREYKTMIQTLCSCKAPTLAGEPQLCKKTAAEPEHKRVSRYRILVEEPPFQSGHPWKCSTLHGDSSSAKANTTSDKSAESSNPAQRTTLVALLQPVTHHTASSRSPGYTVQDSATSRQNGLSIGRICLGRLST